MRETRVGQARPEDVPFLSSFANVSSALLLPFPLPFPLPYSPLADGEGREREPHFDGRAP